jgi:hypothetical protein
MVEQQIGMEKPATAGLNLKREISKGPYHDISPDLTRYSPKSPVSPGGAFAC